MMRIAFKESKADAYLHRIYKTKKQLIEKIIIDAINADFKK